MKCRDGQRKFKKKKKKKKKSSIKCRDMPIVRAGKASIKYLKSPA